MSVLPVVHVLSLVLSVVMLEMGTFKRKRGRESQVMISHEGIEAEAVGREPLTSSWRGLLENVTLAP